MTRAFWTELPEAVRELDAGGAVRAIVISSTGKHFCAGMDLAVFTGGGAAPTAATAATGGRAGVRAQLRETVHDAAGHASRRSRRPRMPVLAAIQGGCIGGAVDMVSRLRHALRHAPTPSSASRRSTSA